MRLVKAVPVVVLFLAWSRVAVADGPDELLKLERFRGSVVGFDIAGVQSGGKPWVIRSGSAKLDADGTFKVEVEGLVFAPGSIVGGVDVSGTTGPITRFAASLACAQADGSHAVVATTPGFPVTTTGDGEVRARIDVPAVCYAPLVLVRASSAATGAAGAWFAAGGF
jgi:hypothetical protein